MTSVQDLSLDFPSSVYVYLKIKHTPVTSWILLFTFWIVFYMLHVSRNKWNLHHPGDEDEASCAPSSSALFLLSRLFLFSSAQTNTMRTSSASWSFSCQTHRSTVSELRVHFPPLWVNVTNPCDQILTWFNRSEHINFTFSIKCIKDRITSVCSFTNLNTDVVMLTTAACDPKTNPD